MYGSGPAHLANAARLDFANHIQDVAERCRHEQRRAFAHRGIGDADAIKTDEKLDLLFWFFRCT
jgi:hypothetical protein